MINISSTIHTALFVAASVICTSCDTTKLPKRGGAGNPKFHIRLCVEENAELADAYAQFGEHRTVGGGLRGGGAVTHLFFVYPLGESAEIHYRTMDGTEHICFVLLPPSVLKPDSSSTYLLVFKINVAEGTVSVVADRH